MLKLGSNLNLKSRIENSKVKRKEKNKRKKRKWRTAMRLGLKRQIGPPHRVRPYTHLGAWIR
jgi:hypothetical protein